MPIGTIFSGMLTVTKSTYQLCNIHSSNCPHISAAPNGQIFVKFYIGDIVRHTVPDDVHHMHVQQPLTYAKPEAASAVLGSR